MLDIKEIMAMLPHRYPMLLVDRINQCDDKKVLAHKSVSFNESFFQGHYPGHPIMPGVLIVEAMMQTSAVLFRKGLVEGTPLVVTSIDNVKFRRPVVPGDRLDLEVTLLRHRGLYARCAGAAFVDGNEVSSAEFSLVSLDPATVHKK